MNPTSRIIPSINQSVAKFITELAAENRIVILTTHDMNLLGHLYGHLFLMEEGSIIQNALIKRIMATIPTPYPKLQNFLRAFDI